MSRPLDRIQHFVRELKRRNVYKVAGTYLVVAFVSLQAVDLLIPATTLPSWADELILAFLIAGFPVSLVVAWAFEMTPEGVRKTPAAAGEKSREPEGEAGERAPAAAGAERAGSGLAVKSLVGLGLLGAAVAGGWYLMGAGGTTISERSVAVLPFETLGDTSSSTFTEGLHNDLITRLQQVSELTVIARPSVMRYEGSDEPLQQVARELNARWIVTAAVQSVGDRVQVNPRLVDPRTGAERWSDSYRRELTAERLFALQEEITRNVVDALQTKLGAGEEERVRSRPTGDLDAYRLYVQGRRRLAQRKFWTEPDGPVPDAVRFFRQAIRRDSSFALAWAGLADAAAVFPSEVPDSVVGPSVEQEFAARRALELDPDLAEAHASVGHVHIQNQDAPAAIEKLQRALELNPSYWEAHNWLGGLYLKIGRAEKAMEHLSQAVKLNPLHARARHYLYDAYLATGQAEKSLREARRQQEMGLEAVSAVAGEIRALYHLSRYEETRRLAQAQVDRLEEGAPWREIIRSYLVIIHAAEGDTARAREIFGRMRSEDVRPEAPAWIEPVAAGWAHAALGEPGRALDAFGHMPRTGWASVGPSTSLRYGIHLDLDPMRDDPRYRQLIREANRAWGLEPDGSLPGDGEGRTTAGRSSTAHVERADGTGGRTAGDASSDPETEGHTRIDG